MELSSIKNYLEKYQKKLSSEEDRRQVLLDSINDGAHLSLKEEQITIHRGVITVHASSAIKNELFLYKEKILRSIKESGRTDVFDIV